LGVKRLNKGSQPLIGKRRHYDIPIVLSYSFHHTPRDSGFTGEIRSTVPDVNGRARSASNGNGGFFLFPIPGQILSCAGTASPTCWLGR
jgi:hypothetical protein